MVEPLSIEFHRSGGPGREELSGTFHDFELGPEDDRAWLGTERLSSRLAGRSERIATYELVFRRGGERRRVLLAEDDLTAQLRPLVDRLVQLCERH
jgi:hypothetical protein